MSTTFSVSATDAEARRQVQDLAEDVANISASGNARLDALAERVSVLAKRQEHNASRLFEVAWREYDRRSRKALESLHAYRGPSAPLAAEIIAILEGRG